MLSGDDAIRRGAPADSLRPLPAACCWASLANAPDKGCSDSSLLHVTVRRPYCSNRSSAATPSTSVRDTRGTKPIDFFLYSLSLLVLFLGACAYVYMYSDASDRHAAASLIPQCQTTTTGERSMHLFPLSAYRMNEGIGDDANKKKDRTCPTEGRGVDLRPGL